MGVTQELQTQGRSIVGAARRPQLEVAWYGRKRSNDTHASTTDPEARLYRESNYTAATLCYSGHLLIEHRFALIVDAEPATVEGYAKRATALEMLAGLSASKRRRTIAGDKNYDTKGSVADPGSSGSPSTSPRNASGNRKSAINVHTTRHAGHAVSQRIRKRVDHRATLRLDEDHRRRT